MPPREEPTPPSTHEDKLQLDLPILLPEIHHERDPCTDRLLERIHRLRGVSDAHILQEDESSEETTGLLCVHYDTDLASLDEIQQAVERAGAQVTERYRHETLRIGGMDCTDCSTSIEHIIARQNGVHDVSVNYAAERARIEYDTEETTVDAVHAIIEKMGYEILEDEALDHDHVVTPLAWPITAALLLTLGFLGETLLPLPRFAVLSLYAGAYLTAGWKHAYHGYHAVRNWTLDIDVLMVTAALGAALLGHWAEGALLLFLFSLGHGLEHRALDHARNAIQQLQELAPSTARVVDEQGQETETPVEELLRGDKVVIRPGERVPADARIAQGQSAVNEAPITGESIPVDKEPGDEVFAGTVNGQGSLTVEVTRLARESLLHRIVDEVEKAQTRKSTTQRFSERFERTLTPTVLVLVALVMVVPALVTFGAPQEGAWAWLGMLALPWTESVLRGLVVLVAASPCALALATPASILAGVAKSARNGVLFKGGAHVEALSEVGAVAFDKTGTVTKGEPSVVRVEPLGGASRADVLACAATLEARSEHPLAVAIVDQAQDEGVAFDPVEALEARVGLGVVGVSGGRRLRVGRERLFEDEGVEVPEEVRSLTEEMPAHASSVIVHDGDGFVGVIALADEPRPEAREAVARLRELVGGPMVLLTGDREEAAVHVAEAVGFDAVHAGLLPEEKVEEVVRLREEHGAVAMVGDGVNDAPAMARSTVGIAMGASGTDVALETADVALMGDRLDRLPFAFGTARRTERVVRENLFLSLAVIGVLVPLAALGLAGFVPAIIAHEGSTLVVVGNALRLLR